jgi:hypothetical protein
MNDKAVIKVVKMILEDKSITDSDKIEAVRKLTDSSPYYTPYPIWGTGVETYTGTTSCPSSLTLNTDDTTGTFKWFNNDC